MDRPILASELFAMANGGMCMGKEECHWCSGPCSRQYIHDDPPPFTIIQNAWGRSCARRPGNPYVCIGCQLWRRKRVTISFLEGGYVDGKCADSFGWWITEEGAWAIGGLSGSVLYEKLLNPPLIFSLSILDGPTIILGTPQNRGITQRSNVNLLQLCLTNNIREMKSDTPLSFTINNIPHTYSIYELEMAIQGGCEGREPGVQALYRVLGKPPEHLKASEKKIGRHKFSDASKGRRVIATSGVGEALTT